MPSNKELIAEAQGLAEALEIPVETDGLSNESLADLVKDLRAKTTDAETDTQADKATEEAKAKKAARMENKKPKVKKPAFYVAAGKSLTSKRGILSGDTSDEVKAEHLGGGKEALDAFVKSGHVLKG
jgi:hypothetical protein